MYRTSISAIALLLASSTLAAQDWPYPEDTPTTEPVTVGLAGTKPADIVRYLLAEGAGNMEVSPNGETIAFSWSITGEPQLWTVDADGGFPKQLTFGGGITSFHWMPDGEGFLVARDAEGNEREGYYRLSTDGTEETVLLAQSDAYRNFGMFSPDGSRFVYSSTERNGRDFDVYVADAETGE